jgi:N-acetylglucosaminyl-diphospho-decaprenol L-rhamnosyltransferase
MDDEDHNRVAILIVGFRNSQDVCACLIALSRARIDPSFDIFICENGGRESFHELCGILAGPQGSCTAVSDDLPKSLISPSERLVDIQCLALKGRPSRVRIGLAAQNLGYAAGINNWIERLMPIPGWEGIWVLNPDTEPDPDALNALVKRAVAGNKGMVGSTIVPFEDQDHVHVRGGHRWRKFMTKLGIIGFREPVNGAVDLQAIEGALDSISGASMYVTRACLEKIGPMDERFFLYYEDADWSFRAKSCGLGYASNSIVPHKGGTTIGSAPFRAQRSRLSVYLESRNRLIFVHMHWRRFFPLGSILGFLYALEYLFVGSPQNFKAALDGLVAGIKGEIGGPPESVSEAIAMPAKVTSMGEPSNMLGAFSRDQAAETATKMGQLPTAVSQRTTPQALAGCASDLRDEPDMIGTSRSNVGPTAATSAPRIRSREITDGDFDTLATFLGNGLGYPSQQFLQIFNQLSQHSTPAGFPRYGYVLQKDNTIVGAVILIFSTIWSEGAPAIRCHVASLYVEPHFRPYATLFFAKALRYKDVTYINTSARLPTRPVIAAQGFMKYSNGQFIAFSGLNFFSRPEDNHVEIVGSDTIPNASFDAHEQELLMTHAKYGCISLWCTTAGHAYPFVFQERLFRGFIPGVQLIFCRDIQDFVRFSRPLGSYLASRGKIVVRIDSNGSIPGLIGMYLDGMEPRFYKGAKPRLGDLAYTQTVMCPYIRRSFDGD